MSQLAQPEQVVRCPRCTKPFRVPQAPATTSALPKAVELGGGASVPDAATHKAPAPVTPELFSERFTPPAAINRAALRDSAEPAAFAWLAICACVPALAAILMALVPSLLNPCMLALPLMCGAPLVAAFFALYIAECLVLAHIKCNAIEVTAHQCPEIHAIAHSFAQRLREPLPTIYVMQDSTFNALAVMLAGKRVLVLHSAAIDSILLKGSMTQLGFLVGHELGHHYAGHLTLWHRTIALLGSWFIWVRLWHSRRCEFTADRYGLVCAGELTASLRAMCNMLAGAQLANAVDVGEAVEQWRRHRGEFFVGAQTLESTHPPTLARIEALVRAGHELGVA